MTRPILGGRIGPAAGCYDRTMEYDTGQAPESHELVRLYDSVDWGVYTEDPDGLVAAVRNSTFVVSARDGHRLVGLARVVSDDVSIMYVQDLLVEPRYQRKGIGRSLLERCLVRFSHVRQRVLFTDDQAHQHRLYEAVGFHDLSKLDGVGLHAFVDIAGATFLSSESVER